MKQEEEEEEEQQETWKETDDEERVLQWLDEKVVHRECSVVETWVGHLCRGVKHLLNITIPTPAPTPIAATRLRTHQETEE
mmetsp:Transcript_21102/g.29220  ORF Transcript_21102/g.29220 Transcript_21102/m.29220 type:complete len:81 (-) Transcript_21102:417-659(-)